MAQSVSGVMLLLASGLPTIARYPAHLVGRLYTPRHVNRVEDTAASGRVWAADNDAFGAWDARRFVWMLDRLTTAVGCAFVVAPDVVADARATRKRFAHWAPLIAARGLPVAYALQDGETSPPWSDCAAVFVGGSTAWKLSADAARLVAAANERGLWTHMGRVNSRRRIEYAKAIGCDSIDGSYFVRWADHSMPWALEHLASGQQQMLS